MLAKLIKEAGGEVKGREVITPGIRIISQTTLTAEGTQLFAALNVDSERPPYEQQSEFCSRLTYMSFREDTQDAQEYNRKMVEEFGHLSMYGAWTVTFLIAGVSAELMLELIAHKEAVVSRLTTSRTKAQDAPLFVMPSSPVLRDLLTRHIEEIDATPCATTPDAREERNKLFAGYKAGALTYTMSLKDFHKTFIGRLSHHGVEKEVREICEILCNQLHALYPLVIKEPSSYYALNNKTKYEG